MPTYRITDPQTGKTIKVTGDSPPTEEELTQIFASQGGAPAAPTVQAPNASIPTATQTKQSGFGVKAGLKGIASLPGKLAQLLNPVATNVGRQIGYGAAFGGQAGELYKQSQEQNANSAKELFELAQRTSDPDAKQRLIDAARRASNLSEQTNEDVLGEAEQKLGIANGGQLATPVRSGAALALETGALLAPGLNYGKTAVVGAPALKTLQLAQGGAGAVQAAPGVSAALQRILAAGATGATRGGAAGASQGLIRGQDTGTDIATKAAVGAGLGGVISGGLQAGGELIGTVGKLFIPKNASTEVWRSAFTVPSQVQDEINIGKTAKKMTEYGVSGNMDDIAAKNASVKAPLLNFRDRVIEAVDTPIEVGEAQNVADDILKSSGIPDLTGNQKKIVLKTIRDTVGVGDEQFGKTNASAAFNAVTKLEDLGFQKLDDATDAFGQISNYSKHAEGKAYIEASKYIKSQIDAASKDNPEIVKKALSPEIIKAFKEFSPRLLEDAKKAKSLNDIRSLIEPFQNLNTMIRTTNRAQNTAFQQGMNRGVPPGGVNALNPATYINPIIRRPEFKTGLGAALASRPSQPVRAAATALSGASRPAMDLLSRLGIPLTARGANQVANQGQNGR